MAYQFDFVPVLANTDLLLRGALLRVADRATPFKRAIAASLAGQH